MTQPILEMRNITKEFPGVKALSNVSFQVAEGEIHCLVGENGAGKSTLMKVLSGVYPHGEYSGQILIHEQEQQFRGIRDSEKAGIAIIYQELALFPELTVYENIFVGHEVKKGFLVDWNETIKQADKMLKKVKLNVNPAARITIGKRLSDRVFLTYVRSLSSSTRDEIILLEYDQSESLAWVLSQNEDRTYALEVRKRVTF